MCPEPVEALDGDEERVRQAYGPASLLVGNARERSFLAPYTRCNVCIASGTHVHVRFSQRQVRFRQRVRRNLTG
jgi:hypothetical protein